MYKSNATTTHSVIINIWKLFCFRLWDIECGACLRVLEGHEELVRCIRFDSKRIVSGAYDGKIKGKFINKNVSFQHNLFTIFRFFSVPFIFIFKVWDLVAALDPRSPASALCLKTLEVCVRLWLLIQNYRNQQTCSYISTTKKLFN